MTASGFSSQELNFITLLPTSAEISMTGGILALLDGRVGEKNKSGAGVVLGENGWKGRTLAFFSNSAEILLILQEREEETKGRNEGVSFTYVTGTKLGPLHRLSHLSLISSL